VARSKGFEITLHVDGARDTLKALNRLPKDANKALRERSFELATTLSNRVRAAALADSEQSALMAPTVKPRRDRLPVIEAGGTKRVGSNRKPAYKILFGSEFGSKHLPQFRPHRGKDSYWFFDAVYTAQAQIAASWSKAADDVINAYNQDGG
jgi:hypothetical protein